MLEYFSKLRFKYLSTPPQAEYSAFRIAADRWSLNHATAGERECLEIYLESCLRNGDMIVIDNPLADAINAHYHPKSSDTITVNIKVNADDALEKLAQVQEAAEATTAALNTEKAARFASAITNSHGTYFGGPLAADWSISTTESDGELQEMHVKRLGGTDTPAHINAAYRALRGTTVNARDMLKVKDAVIVGMDWKNVANTFRVETPAAEEVPVIYVFEASSVDAQFLRSVKRVVKRDGVTWAREFPHHGFSCRSICPFEYDNRQLADLLHGQVVQVELFSGEEIYKHLARVYAEESAYREQVEKEYSAAKLKLAELEKPYAEACEQQMKAYKAMVAAHDNLR